MMEPQRIPQRYHPIEQLTSLAKEIFSEGTYNIEVVRFGVPLVLTTGDAVILFTG